MARRELGIWPTGAQGRGGEAWADARASQCGVGCGGVCGDCVAGAGPGVTGRRPTLTFGNQATAAANDAKRSPGREYESFHVTAIGSSDSCRTYDAGPRK